MDWKSLLAAGIVRKYVLPVAIASLVAWLVANNHPHFADAVCSISDGLAIKVENCE